MKSNVDLTEQGHFSEGWMPGGWRAKGIFRKRKPMETSKLFKDILKMNGKEKKYSLSSMAAKLFGLKLPPIVWDGNNITFDNQIIRTADWTTATTSTSTNGIWVSTGIAD